MLEHNIRIVEDGGDPMCTFRDPAKNVYLAMETESRVYADITSRQGAATKYNPILSGRGVAGPSDIGS